jgi:hypothetical protein
VVTWCCRDEFAQHAVKAAGKRPVCGSGKEASVPATLKVTHKAIGVEVRRGTYDILVDGSQAGSVEVNAVTELPIEPGRHTLKIRSGRNTSRTKTFDADDGQLIAFRCTGKSILPIFLLSFLVPSLAITLRRE